MRIRVTGLLLVIGLAVSVGLASEGRADSISVSDTQSQTTSGQAFNFSFTSLPNPGTDGVFELTIRGDYSGFSAESAVATIDIAGGSLDVGDTANGIISNTISGLTLSSSAKTTYSFDDVMWVFEFDMTDTLLNLAIADGTFSTVVDLDSNVNAFSSTAFASVGLSYQSVPEPGTLALLGLGVLGIALHRRRRSVKAS